jgi:hypothetical protein
MQIAEDFMRSLEEDARERAEKRKIREKEATAIKDIANKLFKKGQYEDALQLYNKVADLFLFSY